MGRPPRSARSADDDPRCIGSSSRRCRRHWPAGSSRPESVNGDAGIRRRLRGWRQCHRQPKRDEREERSTSHLAPPSSPGAPGGRDFPRYPTAPDRNPPLVAGGLMPRRAVRCFERVRARLREARCPPQRTAPRMGPDGCRQPPRFCPLPRLGERPHPDDSGRPFAVRSSDARRFSTTAAPSRRFVIVDVSWS